MHSGISITPIFFDVKYNVWKTETNYIDVSDRCMVGACITDGENDSNRREM